MRSKRSCCNATVFKKNMTRFAPVWILYTLCLCLGIILIYSDGGELREYWFPTHYTELLQVLALVNLGYALLTAQLLFGDLFNSRMCNALHALPLRREEWFFSNCLSGLAFSLIPTAAMTLLGLLLAPVELFTNARQMILLVWLGANLQYICFFGIAVFSTMCTGNRFAMVAGYGLVNLGAMVVYFLVDTIYTPLLYGVVTPTALAERLTPAEQLMRVGFESPLYSELFDGRGNRLPGVDAVLTLGEGWVSLLAWAGAGLVFALIALVLYRRRHLECAGDAVAFPALVPFFQVTCAIVVAVGAQFVMVNVMGVVPEHTFLILSAGLVVGWFVGKMLTTRSVQVFQLRNWLQLAALTAVIGVSLLATKLDVFGIHRWVPEASQVRSVIVDMLGYGQAYTFEAPEDITAILRLHQQAIEDKLEDVGIYVLVDGQPVPADGNGVPITAEAGSLAPTVAEEFQTESLEDNRIVVPYARVYLTYELTNEKTVRRSYSIWSHSEGGDILRNLFTRWEVVDYDLHNGEEWQHDLAERAIESLRTLSIDGHDQTELEELQNPKTARSLLNAIKADSRAGVLAQAHDLHDGYFRIPRTEEEMRYYSGEDLEPYYDSRGLYISFQGAKSYFSLRIYPDCVNTLAWLEAHGLANFEVYSENRLF